VADSLHSLHFRWIQLINLH